MLGKLFACALAFSTSLNVVFLLVLLSFLGPSFTGDYEEEDISLVAKVHRLDFISQTLKKEIENGNNKILPVVVLELSEKYGSPVSVRTGEHAIWIYLNNYSLVVLNKEETRGVIAHELGHAVLGHTHGDDIRKEIEADAFALRYVDPGVLAESISKLSANDREKNTRLQAIGVASN